VLALYVFSFYGNIANYNYNKSVFIASISNCSYVFTWENIDFNELL